MRASKQQQQLNVDQFKLLKKPTHTHTHTHTHNVSQVFSRAGLLADPNLLPSHLSTLVMVGFNKNAFKPQIAAIKNKYHEMFRNKTKS